MRVARDDDAGAWRFVALASTGIDRRRHHRLTTRRQGEIEILGHRRARESNRGGRREIPHPAIPHRRHDLDALPVHAARRNHEAIASLAIRRSVDVKFVDPHVRAGEGSAPRGDVSRHGHRPLRVQGSHAAREQRKREERANDSLIHGA